MRSLSKFMGEHLDFTPESFPKYFRNLTLKTKANWPARREPAIALGSDEGIPIPNLANRRRIQGQGALDDAEAKDFRPGGRFDVRCVLNVMEVCGPQNFGQNSRVLDWGVGCGRMARHLPERLRPGLAGIDVDPINIEWCLKYMPFGEYKCVDPYGRAPFSDRQFDLIYSHSVMTHLKPDDQAHWLRELARISRGTMIISIHGMYDVGMTRWSHEVEPLVRWMGQGIIGGKNQNQDIADVTPAGYYTDVHMTAKYIYDVWSEFVDVYDIVIGGFGYAHDAVVCSPKGVRI